MAKEKTNKTANPNIKIRKYLAGGNQTKITPEIQRLADMVVKGELEQTYSQIMHIIHQLEIRRDKGDLLNTRTADQIINSGFWTGCTDMALAFTAISRAAGIPVKIVETVDKTWLVGDNEGAVSGHVYVKTYDGKAKRWVLTDPTKKYFDIEMPTERIMVSEGVDVWGMGMKNRQEKLTVLKEFRTEWRSKNNLG